MGTRTYSVIGTTEGALALAAELKLAGNRIIVSDLQSRSDALLELAAAPGLDVDCQVEEVAGGKQKVRLTGLEVTANLFLAATEADIIVVMTPQTAYEEMIDAFKSALRADHIILLCPGGVGGALVVQRLAVKAGAEGILVAQTASMPLGGRKFGPHELRIVSKKRSLPVGAYPARRTQELIERLQTDFPQFVATTNVLECGLASAAPGLHPVPMIMNAARIEAEGPYIYSAYEITPTVARVIEAVDEERRSIVRALGGKPSGISELLYESYGVTGNDFYEVVHNVSAYQNVKSPPDLRYRYLSEDVPTQLVPAVVIANTLGLETPMLEAIVAFANVMHGCNYWELGWSLDRLGLSGLSAETLRAML